MADEIVSIRIRLSGGKEAAAEAKLVSTEIKGVGTATAEASAASATAGGKMRGVVSRLRGAWSAIKRVAKLGAVGIAAGAIAVGVWGKHAVSSTLELAKAAAGLHNNFNISYESASGLLNLLKVRGADTKKTGLAIKSLQTNLRNAATGSESAIGVFRKLGFSQKDIQKSSQDTGLALHEVAKGFGNLPRSGAKGVLLAKLFGKSYEGIAPLLREGNKAYAEQMDKAREYGAVIGGKPVTSLTDLAEAQREMQLAQIGWQITFATKVAPTLTKIFTAIAKFTNGMRTGTGAGGKFAAVMKAIGIGLKYTFIGIKVATEWTITASKAVARWSRGAAEWLARAYNNVKGFVTGLWPLKIAVALVVIQVRQLVAVLKGPMRLAWYVVSNAVKLAWTFLKVFGRIVGDVVAIVTNLLRGDWAGAWRAAKRLVGDYVHGGIELLQQFVGYLKGLPGAIGGALVGVGKAIARPFIWAWGKIKAIWDKIKGIKDSITGAVGSIVPGGGSGVVPDFVPGIGGLQHGTRSFPGGLAVVGEVGPELVSLPRGSDVIPHRQSKEIAFRGERVRRPRREIRQPVQLKLDGRVLAETVVSIQDDEDARQ